MDKQYQDIIKTIQAFDRLPPRETLILRFLFLEGKTLEDAKKVFGNSIKLIEQVKKNALEKIKKALE